VNIKQAKAIVCEHGQLAAHDYQNHITTVTVTCYYRGSRYSASSYALWNGLFGGNKQDEPDEHRGAEVAIGRAERLIADMIVEDNTKPRSLDEDWGKGLKDCFNVVFAPFFAPLVEGAKIPATIGRDQLPKLPRYNLIG